MRYAELDEMVESMGLPCAYRAFRKDTARPAPFICYYYDKNDDLFADNINYQEIVVLIIELYTREKELVIEKHMEKVLREHEMSYEKESLYIESQGMHETIYEMEVVING